MNNMARPTKQGLDYFPLDVDIDQDEKVALVESQHGLIGFAIVIKLLMRIYKNGYFHEWGEREQLLFSKRINVDINYLNEIINDCLKWGLFDENVYKKHKILTSRGIQKRYLEAVKRRKEIKFIKEYSLLHHDFIKDYTNIVIVNINNEIVSNNNNNLNNGDKNEINVNINSDIIDINTTKEKKRKEIKRNEKRSDIVVQGSNENADQSVNIYDEFFKCFGRQPTPILLDELNSFIDQDGLEPELLVKAFRKAGEVGATYQYAKTILNNWIKKGIKTVEAADEEERNYQMQKQAKMTQKRNPRVTPLPKWMTEKKEELEREMTPEEKAEYERKKKELEERFKKYY